VRYQDYHFHSLTALLCVAGCAGGFILIATIVNVDILTNTPTLYRVSFVLIVATTVLYCLWSAVAINREFHYNTLRDLRAASFCLHDKLNEALFQNEGGEKETRDLLRNVADVDNIITAIEASAKFPGLMFRQEIKPELLTKIAVALLASLLSSLLRANIT